MNDPDQLTDTELSILEYLVLYDRPDKTNRRGTREEAPVIIVVQDIIDHFIELGLAERLWYGVDEHGEAIGYIVATDQGKRILFNEESQRRLDTYHEEVLRDVDWARRPEQRHTVRPLKSR